MFLQCQVGHMVCSRCCDKLKARGKCHLCGISTGGYSRCHGMERLVESIRIRCLNAAHGCTTRPAYYDHHSHSQTCPHAPCHCPGEECSFIGSTTALLDHIAYVHGWPCTTKIKVGYKCSVDLRDGFNFLLAYRDANGIRGTMTSPGASNQWLVLMNVACQPLDHVISMLCIHPRANADVKSLRCSLTYYYSQANDQDGVFCNYYQSSSFKVACTDLSSGLPNLDECSRFVVPNSIVGGNSIMVDACIDILDH